MLTQPVKCLLLSIRLNQQAVHHLLHDSGCDSIIVSPRTRSSVWETRNDKGTFKAAIHCTDAVAFGHFLGHKSEDLAFSRLENGKNAVREDDRNVIILHSSGTTGQLAIESWRCAES